MELQEIKEQFARDCGYSSYKIMKDRNSYLPLEDVEDLMKESWNAALEKVRNNQPDEIFYKNNTGNICTGVHGDAMVQDEWNNYFNTLKIQT